MLSFEIPLIKTISLKKKPIAPLDLFQTLDFGSPSFLLDGSAGGWFDGKFSLIGTSPFGIFHSKDGLSYFSHNGSEKNFKSHSKGKPLDFLQTWLDLFQAKKSPETSFSEIPFLQGGCVGFLSYDLVRQIEKIPPPRHTSPKIPDIIFLFINLFIVIDQKETCVHIIYNPTPEIQMGNTEEKIRKKGHEKIREIETKLLIRPQKSQRLTLASSLKTRADCSESQYISMVHRAKSYISAGDIFQANLSYRFTAQAPEDGSLFQIYKRLWQLNPSPFASYLNLGDIEIASASPERLVRVTKGLGATQIETRPIAGTKPRGKNHAEDKIAISSLYRSKKERAEHLMMVDLERNDIGKICRYGSVSVDAMMTLEKYSHVFHLVSNINGELLPETSATQIIKALFPGGTITGVPKVRCMEIIAELEKKARGIYTGSIGYIGFDGEMDLNIVIRSWLRTGKIMSLQVGAGIVADSDPLSEYQETRQKASALIEAIHP
ncbi:MAG: anthranilate synthase component I family protein [Nitrospiria bacterium]